MFNHDKKALELIKNLYAEKKAHNTHISIALSLPQLLDDSIDYYYKSEKALQLLDLLDNGIDGEKVIIYSPYKTVVERMAQIVHKELGKDYSLIVGGADTQAEKEKFNSGKADLLFMTNAGAAGLNLQSAGNIVFLNMPFTAGDYFQIAGRISRVGTTHTKLTLHFLITDNSNDLDWYNCIQGQAKFLQTLNADLVDDGIVDEAVSTLTEDDADKYIKLTLKNRKEQYS